MNDLQPKATKVPEEQSSGSLQKSNAQQMVAESMAEIKVARNFPRRPSAIKKRVLDACERKSFAEAATYEYPRGGETVKGPSIRLLERIASEWGHLDFGWSEINRNIKEGYSECRAWARDLQSNTKHSKEFVVEHVRNTKYGKKDLDSERDIYEKVANFSVRRMRSCIKALVPSDIIDDAMKVAEQTKVGQAKKSKAEQIESLVAAFNDLGVTADMLSDYIGRDIENAAPEDISSLRSVYSAIKDDAARRDEYFGEEDSSTKVDVEAESDESTDDTEEPDETTQSFQEQMERVKNKATGQSGESDTEPEPSEEPEEKLEIEDPYKDIMESLKGLGLDDGTATNARDWIAAHKSGCLGADLSPSDAQEIAVALREAKSVSHVVRQRLKSKLREYWVNELEQDEEIFDQYSASLEKMTQLANSYHDNLVKTMMTSD